MNTTMMLLFVRYESPRLSIDQVADFMGLDVRTVRNMRSANKLPFAMYQQGSNWFADIRDRKDPRAKAGNHQTVPLLGEAFAIVQRQPRTDERIFPYNTDTWSTIFPRACKTLGIVDLRLHDLRHEGISRLVESGKYSIPEIMLVSGHRDPRMLMRYVQLKARDLHR